MLQPSKLIKKIRRKKKGYDDPCAIGYLLKRNFSICLSNRWTPYRLLKIFLFLFFFGNYHSLNVNGAVLTQVKSTIAILTRNGLAFYTLSFAGYASIATVSLSISIPPFFTHQLSIDGTIGRRFACNISLT